ncbi:DUF3017 domain-containing protein [Pengzhenrongella sicca]|uniref:DUF3017 domain-containing protein n=1 Tax=Pengzhenrongella sicca TaxID=2819238 RepID=A0A8A4ZK54_9MICO|nr:DUF3017 domain-containing protein [Pengzhenrongella sicca]QTE29978.1 DUF3017 domain-containing protein [Pengzhenrongella sicca]
MQQDLTTGLAAASTAAHREPARESAREPAREPVREAVAEPAREPVREPEPELDVRATARASLAAGRTPSLWWTCTGLGISLALVLTVGVATGGLVLAIGLACAGLARAVLPSPGPVAFTVRSRVLDVAVLLLLAVGVGFLSQVIPVR